MDENYETLKDEFEKAVNSDDPKIELNKLRFTMLDRGATPGQVLDILKQFKSKTEFHDQEAEAYVDKTISDLELFLKHEHELFEAYPPGSGYDALKDLNARMEAKGLDRKTRYDLFKEFFIAVQFDKRYGENDADLISELLDTLSD